MTKAWEIDLPQGKKLLLLALCDHANDDGVCYPSQEKLMRKCGIGQTTLTNHIKWFEQVGILRRTRRHNGRSRKSDLYEIDLDAYEPSKSEASNYEPSNYEASDFELKNLQILNDEPSDFEGCFKEEPPIEPSIEPSIYTPPSIEPKKQTGEKKQGVWAEGLALITDKGVNEQVAKDFIAVRKSHKAPLTMTALGRIEREAGKAGLTLEQAVCLCAEKGWRGFEAEWLTNSTQSMHSSKPSIKDVPKHTAGGVLSW